MLSVGLPADVTADLLITPVLVTFVATVASIALALRTRAVLAPAAPTLLALVTGLLFTASRPAAGLPVTAAYLLATLLLVVVRVIWLESQQAAAMLDVAPTPDPRRRRRIAGRIAFGLPVALVVAALGISGARFVPVASGTARFDPRTVTPRQFQVEDTLTPLVGLKSQLREQPARTLFTVQLDGTGIDRVRTAALDTYDGALWTSDDTFLVAGHTLPADPNLENPRQVRARIEIQDLTGPYLPVVGWPVQVGATGLGFSARSGVLVTHGPDVHGLGYDLVGTVAPDDAGLRTAVPNLTGDAVRDTQLPPGLPPELDAKARELTAQGSRTPSWWRSRTICASCHTAWTPGRVTRTTRCAGCSAPTPRTGSGTRSSSPPPSRSWPGTRASRPGSRSATCCARPPGGATRTPSRPPTRTPGPRSTWPGTAGCPSTRPTSPSGPTRSSRIPTRRPGRRTSPATRRTRATSPRWYPD